MNQNPETTPLISVVVPVYNVEPWLAECLDSIVHQTISDMEIICVNDGSTDGSAEILSEYAGRDDRIKIITQENKGLSEARNTGVRAARGKYLFFMDSDDVLELNALKLCTADMEQRDLEFVCFNVIGFGDDPESAKAAGIKNRRYFRRSLDDTKVYTGQELFHELIQRKAYIAPVVSCVLLRSAFLEYDLWFYPGILHEDEIWMFTAHMCLSRCGCINKILYRTRFRDHSIMRSGVSFARLYGMFTVSRVTGNYLAEHPQLLENEEQSESELFYLIKLQKNAVSKYLACSAEERQEAFDMSPEERVLYEQMIAYPASLQDTIVKRNKENASLKKKNKALEKQNAALKKDKQKLQSQVKTLRAEKKKLKSKLKRLKNSYAYRMGRLITWIPRRCKALLRKWKPVQKDRPPVRVRNDNRLEIFQSEVSGNRITYQYEVRGEWKKYFRTNKSFEITYPFDLAGIPESIRIIPFLSQVIPVSWVCDAEITVPACDKDFFDCLDDVKEGYRKMYPMISFAGKITAGSLETNTKAEQQRVLSCFSGGVDAFSTVISHLNETPILSSIWGSDVPWTDEKGWKPVDELIDSDAEKLGLERVVIRSSFRDLLIQKKIDETVRESGDTWWHGFWHGLGILGHMAPVAFALNAGRVYIAASFTAEYEYTCASDPMIDNNVRFCGARVVHDGYDTNRQDKIGQIVRFARENDVEIPLHVCWEKAGGDNCCHCEKCWRTMLGLFAEGADPREYGFKDFDNSSHFSDDIEKKYHRFIYELIPHYQPIQDRLRSRLKEDEVPEELKWLYQGDLSKIQDGTLRLHNNKLREPIWLLGTSEHNNMGDHFISDEEIRFLNTLFPDRHVIEFSYKELEKKQFEQLNVIRPSQLIVMNGGGSFGNIWPGYDEFRGEIIKRFPNNPIIIFPQSIFFSEDEAGQAALAQAEEIYRGDNLLLCCRDRVSYEYALEHFECRSILVPDIVMWEAEEPAYPQERYGAMTVLRDDRERKITDADTEAIVATLFKRFDCLDMSDMIIEGPIVNKRNRREKEDILLTRIASAECVVTDRLHGMVLCAVTGTPCVVLANGYHKVKACHEWFEDIGYIRFIEDVGQLDAAIDAVLRCEDRTYPETEIQKQFEPLVQWIVDRAIAQV